MSREARKQERQEIYQSRMWKDIRKRLQMERPLCEDCLKEGKVTPMEEIHHIKSPFRKGLSEDEKLRLAYDESNLVCLCKECHWRRHHPEGIIQDKLKKYAD